MTSHIMGINKTSLPSAVAYAQPKTVDKIRRKISLIFFYLKEFFLFLSSLPLHFIYGSFKYYRNRKLSLEDALFSNLFIYYSLVCLGANLQEIHSQGISLLHRAAQKGNQKMIHFLIQRKNLSPNATTEKGWSALHFAIINQKIKAVEELLSHSQILPNLPNSEGWTPLHIAASSGNEELIFLLLTHHADPSLKTKRGKTPDKVYEVQSNPKMLQAYQKAYHRFLEQEVFSLFFQRWPLQLLPLIEAYLQEV